MAKWIGIDVGGTNLVCGLLNEEFKVIRTVRARTQAELGAAAVLDLIADLVRQVMQQEGISTGDIGAIGLGVPGFIDPETGVCLLSANLKWDHVQVSAELQQKLELPVFVDNDVRMYVLGEALKGAGAGYGIVYGLTIGTGLNSALVDHGRLYYGSRAIAGEIGHIPMGENALCGCGLTGCLETAASATGIARLAREAIQNGERSLLADRFPDMNKLTAADVSAAYDEGDHVAIHAMHHAGTLLGRAMAMALTLFNPDVLIIGGGGAQAGERIIGAMEAEMKKGLLPMYYEKLSIKIAALGDEAGIVGSALYASSRS